MKKIRWIVFLPPWILMMVILILNFVNYDVFVATIDICTNWILNKFTGWFCLLTFVGVLLIVITYISPVSNVRIGGEDSKPLVSYKNYVWIVLCTIMAAGIMFWACSEPLYHMYQPPANVIGGAGSNEAIKWSMEIMFLEWTFTPMCIYGLPAILFAFVFYNMKMPFSIGSMFVPFIGDKLSKKIMPFIDIVCLFALCSGMAASLGQGVLLLSGGIENYSGGLFKSGAFLWFVSTCIIVFTFIISASLGLKRGIQKISNLNSVLYLILGAGVFLFGPTIFILNFGIENAGNYFADFFRVSLFTGAVAGKEWVQSWPGFYWCSWLAWMPITAVFLGKISKGYTIKQMIRTIIAIPALFSMVWIMLFSGSTIYLELKEKTVYSTMLNDSEEAVIYKILETLPLAKIFIILFLVVLLISFVTAADSNTNAMSSLCTEGLTPEDTESPVILKIVWGVTIGSVCLIMLISYGVDGIKKLSNIGGFPDSFLMLFFMISWIKILINPKKYSKV